MSLRSVANLVVVLAVALAGCASGPTNLAVPADDIDSEASSPPATYERDFELATQAVADSQQIALSAQRSVSAGRMSWNEAAAAYESSVHTVVAAQLALDDADPPSEWRRAHNLLIEAFGDYALAQALMSTCFRNRELIDCYAAETHFDAASTALRAAKSAAPYRAPAASQTYVVPVVEEPEEVDRAFVVTVQNERIAEPLPSVVASIGDDPNDPEARENLYTISAGEQGRATIELTVPANRTQYKLWLDIGAPPYFFEGSENAAPDIRLEFAFAASNDSGITITFGDNFSQEDSLEYAFNCEGCDMAPDTAALNTATASSTASVSLLNWRQSARPVVLNSAILVAEFPAGEVASREMLGEYLSVGGSHTFNITGVWPEVSPPTSLRLDFTMQVGSAGGLQDSTMSFPLALALTNVIEIQMEDGFDRPDGLLIRASCEPCADPWEYPAAKNVSTEPIRLEFTLINRASSDTYMYCNMNGWESGERQLFGEPITSRKDIVRTLTQTPSTPASLASTTLRCYTTSGSYENFQFGFTSASSLNQIRFEHLGGGTLDGSCTSGCQMHRVNAS